MALHNLTSAQIAQLIRLIKKKESLEAQLHRVTGLLTSLEGGTSPVRRGRKPGRPPKIAPVGRPPGTTGKRGRRLKLPLLKALKKAGPTGITVKELSAKLKVKPNNIFSWFYTTGRKIKGITKVGEAKYAFSE